jgi:hypothetical protein
MFWNTKNCNQDKGHHGTENRLRGIASLIDWNAQIRLFRSRLAGSQR